MLIRGVVSSPVRGVVGSGGMAAWEVTRSQLLAYLATTDGADNPHSLPAMSSPPTITTGAGSSASPPAPYTGLTQAFLHAAGTLSAKIRQEGGGTKTYAVDYRWFPVATIAATGGNTSDGTQAVVWRCSAICDASAVGIRVLGGSTNKYRMIVDGEYVSFSQTVMATGGRQYIVLDFGSKASRTITIEAQQAAALTGFHVAVGDTVSAAPEREFRGLALGDSFVEATGATAMGDGLIQIAADYLGVELWSSGVGGSGYVNTQSGTKYKLSERLTTDIARFVSLKGSAPNIVFVPMGLNDIGLADVEAEAKSCFDTIRQLCPTAVVFVVTPWDVAAPSAPSANYATTKAAIQAAAAGRGGFVVLDPQGVSFTKADSTHPDTAGHTTLALWLQSAARTALAA